MRTAVISDIHIDVNESYDVIGGIVDYVREKKVELLLIAGDISSYPEKTIETVRKLEELSGAVVHDFTNGLKIGGIKIRESQDGVVYVEGNLVVKGGKCDFLL